MQQEKKNKELFWTKIFIEHINRVTRFGYKVAPHPKQHSIIDSKGISQSKKYPEICMQLRWVEEIELNPKKPPRKYLFFKPADIHKAINAKTEKFEKVEKYKKYKNKIILLLHGYMAKPWADAILTHEFCNRYQFNPFKGIYYIVQPSTSKVDNEPLVLPIKRFRIRNYLI